MSISSRLKPVIISGKEVLPIIEGGKGVSATNGHSSGAFAKSGAVGTFSGVNADSFDAAGNIVPQIYRGTTRRERHEELITYGIEGGVTQAQIAHELSGGEGRIHINVLWEMGGAQRVLQGILERTKGMVHGVTCGAGMPYKLAEIAAKYNVYYHPIISSMRAFRALWLRSYRRVAHLLGSVVYEDPWLAGGHNGLSNSENPENPEDPYPRVVELRRFMNEVGLKDTPIIMAGGVWYLRDWEHWLDNPEIGPIAFQYGTRPLVTKESPVPEAWKQKLLTLNEGDVLLNRFSPTGFYSSAVRNTFLKELEARNERQVAYVTAPDKERHMVVPFPFGPRKRPIYMMEEDFQNAEKWLEEGFDEPLKSPDSTLVFVSKEKAAEIHKDQVDCMGCLSHCRFSNWKDYDDFTTGKKPDPRSFCIQKTLQDIAHGGPVDNNLMFAGHNAFNFKNDPFYSNGFIPTVGQLVDRIMTGD
ncbi:MAG: nitronate monooxygenase [Hyphomicrobiales bacterium]|nr:nitronate monooxygenase [Hyphomicrobiales bacterium]